MIRKTDRRRFGFANVTAMIALFVALGGSAWAVAKVERNSVYSSSIKNKEVKTADLDRMAVKNKNVSPETIKSSRIKDGHVRAGEIGAIVERTDTIPVIDGSQNNTTVGCDPDELLLGGGASWDQLNTNVRLQQSHADGNGWNAAGQNSSGATRQLTVKAYCLQP